MGIDLLVVLQQPFLYLLWFITWTKYFLLSTVVRHAWHHWIPPPSNTPLIITKEANPTFGLYCETRTGFLIIMSLLHSTQGEPSISCHRVRAHGVIFSKVPLIVGTDVFISFLWESTPTHCCTYMYLGGAVIPTGVTGLGLMTGNEWAGGPGGEHDL